MLGDGGLVQAVLSRVYLTENERLRPNISIRGPLWWIVGNYSWFSHSLRCPKYSVWSSNPERRDLSCDTRLWGWHDDWWHWWCIMYLQMGWNWVLSLHCKTKRNRGNSTSLLASYTTRFQVLPSLGSMHSNTFTATPVRTSMLTWGQQQFVLVGPVFSFF